MYNRLHEHNLLFERQFCFLAGYSTEHVITELIDKLLHSLDQNLYTFRIFINLFKAFDTVNQIILLKKLYYNGEENQNLKWFQSYLSHRIHLT